MGNDSKPAAAAARLRRQRLAELLAPVRGALWTASVLQVVAAVAAVAPLALIGVLATEIIGGEPDPGRATAIVLGVVGALFLRALCATLAAGVTHLADIRLQQSLRDRLVETFARLPLSWFARTPSGRVRKFAQDDVAGLHYLVAHGQIEVVAGIATPAVGIAWCFVLDWRLGLVALLPVLAYGMSFALLMRGAEKSLPRVAEAMTGISSTIVEFVSGVAVLKTFGRSGRAHDRFRAAADDFTDAYGRWVGPNLRVSAATAVVLSAPVVLLVTAAAGTWFLAAGWVGPVEVMTAALITMVVPSTVVALGFGLQHRREAVAAAERLTELFAVPSLSEPRTPRAPTGHDVRLAGVRFGYADGPDVLHDVDLHLRPGTVTALVGPSGAGKSTLATLVARFDDPRAGSVRLGGIDVREIGSAELYRQVGFVLQEPGLLGISLRDNIRLARPEATDAEVVSAARAARIDERIRALPGGYDTVYGEAVSLSGGEQQRVAIARALLADTPVLVLDEATAFADPDTEAQVQTALSRLMTGRTVLVIAHRLPSVVAADAIVVLDEGRVVERGTHGELVAAGGAYARLWALHTEGVAV